MKQHWFTNSYCYSMVLKFSRWFSEYKVKSWKVTVTAEITSMKRKLPLIVLDTTEIMYLFCTSSTHTIP